MRELIEPRLVEEGRGERIARQEEPEVFLQPVPELMHKSDLGVAHIEKHGLLLHRSSDRFQSVCDLFVMARLELRQIDSALNVTGMEGDVVRL